MEDLRTTVTGIVGGIVTLAAAFDFIIPQDAAVAIGATVMTILGIMMRDGKAVRKQ